jgi:hypothetical protein
MVGIGEDGYHATGNQLTPECHQRSLSSIKESAYYTLCVGISYKALVSNVLQKLRLCGKCIDWAVVTVCVLSTHPFLSYALMLHTRWAHWAIVGIGFFLQTSLYFSFGIPFEKTFEYVDIFFVIWTGVDVLNLSDLS